MARSENFGFRLAPEEKVLLALVSQREERTASDVIRRLIRYEAKRHGLLPGGEGRQTARRQHEEQQYA